MSVPRLDRKFTLETPVRLPDGAGGYTLTWQALGLIWAALDGRSGGETSAQSVPLSRGRFALTVRGAPYGSPSRPRAGQRFRDGDRLLSITAVTEADSAGRFLTCHVTEEVAT